MIIVVLADRMVQVLYPMLHVWKVEMVRRDVVVVVVVHAAVDVDVVVPCRHDSFFSVLD